MQRIDHKWFVNYRSVVIAECVCVCVCITVYCFECAVAIRVEDIGGKAVTTYRSSGHYVKRLALSSVDSGVG